MRGSTIITTEDILVPCLREVDHMERRLRGAILSGREPVEQAAETVCRLMASHLRWLLEMAKNLGVDVDWARQGPHELLPDSLDQAQNSPLHPLVADPEPWP